MRNNEEKVNNNFEMKISSLRNVLAEAENDITRGTACKLRDNIVKMRENFASEKKRLNYEIQRLKRRVRDAEETRQSNGNGQIKTIDQLKSRLREFASGDRTMEMIFRDIVGRIAVTVPNLSEELVNVSEDLYRFNCENARLRYEIDKLQAMLRIKTGDPESYLKRITEFKDISRRLSKNLTRLRDNIDNEDDSWDFLSFLETVKSIDETMNELETKVKTDRQALMVAGNPVCFRYVKKIVSARLILKKLYTELENSLIQMEKSSNDRNNLEVERYIEKVSVLKKIIKQTSVELGQLKIEPVSNCKLGGTSCLEYLKKVRTLEETLKRCKGKIKELDVNSEEKDDSRAFRSKKLDELGKVLDELCSQLMDLENMIYFGDDSKLLGKIEELEELLVKTKLELSVKEETVTSLETRLEHGRKELEKRQEENTILAKQIDAFEEDSKNRLVEMRQVRSELDDLKTQLQSLRKDKENLFTETENMQKLLAERNEEISRKLTAKDTSLRKLQDALEKTTKEKEELSKKLLQASEKEISRGRIERELSQTKSSLTEANNVIGDLRKKLDRTINEIKTVEQEGVRLTSENETLKQLSNLGEKTREEYRSLLSKHATLESKVVNYDRENNELKLEITELRTERKLLKSRMDELESRNSSLLEQVEKWRITRASLEKEADGWKERSNELASVLERANGELRDLRTENSTLTKDLSALTLKNNEAEARLRVASTEKDNLATRTKELNEENVSVKDRLNKARAEREYLSSELNKSRIECDKARSRNTELGKMLGELRDKYEETKNRYKILDDQAKSLRASNETLRSENIALKAHSSEFLERFRIVAEANEMDDISSNENLRRKGKKESIKSRDKVKRKDKLKNEAKMLRLQNESLKLEIANLKTESAEIRMELARVKNVPIARSASDVLEIMEFRNVFLQNREDINKASSSQIESKREQFPSSNEMSSLELEARRELRKKFETLSSAMSKLRIVNGALRTEIEVLRDSMHAAVTDKERALCELQRTVDELKALKVELIKLRDEKGTLRTRLDDTKKESENLRTEKIALKNELMLLRTANSDLKLKISDLENALENLRTISARLGNKLVGTLKNVNKYTISGENPNEFENELNGILIDYTSMKESLGIANIHLGDQNFAQGENTNV